MSFGAKKRMTEEPVKDKSDNLQFKINDINHKMHEIKVKNQHFLERVK